MNVSLKRKYKYRRINKGMKANNMHINKQGYTYCKQPVKSKHTHKHTIEFIFVPGGNVKSC